jgi:phage regulator Rha-like protein
MTTLIPGKSQTPVRMTSLEIAELTKKRHDSVKRTIKTLVASGVIAQPQIVEIGRINNLGLPATTKVYVFDLEHKRDSLIVVAQLSPEFTAAMIDRWQVLEEGQAKLGRVHTNRKNVILQRWKSANPNTNR